MASRLISRQLLRHPISRTSIAPRTPILLQQQQQQRHVSTDPDITDPNMNGGYINPPRIKRQFRDPHADWWDKQERRNFGEPLHEDNDILGIFSPEEYTHFSPAMSFFLIGCFAAAVGALAVAVGLTYPDRPAVPREFPGGLEEELGGVYAVRARKEGDPLD